MAIYKFSQFKKERVAIREAKAKEAATKKYTQMFNEKLKEFGVSNPSELSEEDQIKFYDSLKPVSESVETEEEKIDEKKAEESKHEEEEKAEESNCDDEEEEEEEEIQDLNEASDITKEELKSFLEKNEKHFAAFLKPKKLIVSLTSDKLIVEPKSNSFAYTVDFGKKKIYTTGKPDSMESVSYVEIGETLKHRTGFGEPIQESVEINEADIKDEASFRKYAEDVLKKAHGDDYDEAKAKKMIDDIAKKYGEDGDWGDAVGVVQQSLD